jgi:hypothetical protein
MKTPVCYFVAAFLALPSVLVAQAGQSNSSLPSTPQGLLGLLAGTWHFDLYAQGSTGPLASGQREMRLWADSMKVTWTETFVGQSKTGTGILGYNAATGAYYVLGALERQPSPMILVGRADSSGRTVVFEVGSTDIRVAKPAIYATSELRLVDADHFEWVTLDGSWRGVYNRIGHS